jgi:virulence-associated protein VagC
LDLGSGYNNSRSERKFAVPTAEIISIDGQQLVKLPAEFHFDTTRISVRKDGDAVVLEPIKPTSWPARFFDDIRVEDPRFVRPPQGDAPPAPALDSVS